MSPFSSSILQVLWMSQSLVRWKWMKPSVAGPRFSGDEGLETLPVKLPPCRKLLGSCSGEPWLTMSKPSSRLALSFTSATRTCRATCLSSLGV